MDPQPRPTHYHGDLMTEVKSPKPGYRYCLASLADKMTGFEYLIMLGWEPVRYGDGETVGGARETKENRGQYVTYMDQGLMRMPMERHMQNYRKGVGGGRGQEYFDWQEQRMLEAGGVDPLRGMRGGLPPSEMGTENETKRQEVDWDE